MYQVRMKDQRISLRLIDLPVTVDTCHLSRRKKNQCAFLVVISMATVYQVTAFYILQKYGIKTEIHPGTRSRTCFRQVNNTDKRMQGFIVVKSVVFAYCFKSSHGIHITFIY